MTGRRGARRQQLLREAEGYLELLTAPTGHWEAGQALRTRIGQRVLRVLDRLGDPGAFRRDVLLLRGQAYRVMERLPEAIEALESCAREESASLTVWLALGWCYKRTGRLDLAVQALEEALEVDPDEAVVYYNLACYWALADNVAMACEYLEQAIEMEPDLRDMAAHEEDFHAIRQRPEFRTLLSVSV